VLQTLKFLCYVYNQVCSFLTIRDKCSPEVLVPVAWLQQGSPSLPPRRYEKRVANGSETVTASRTWWLEPTLQRAPCARERRLSGFHY
jgi:hypothetical protein